MCSIVLSALGRGTDPVSRACDVFTDKYKIHGECQVPPFSTPPFSPSQPLPSIAFAPPYSYSWVDGNPDSEVREEGEVARGCLMHRLRKTVELPCYCRFFPVEISSRLALTARLRLRAKRRSTSARRTPCRPRHAWWGMSSDRTARLSSTVWTLKWPSRSRTRSVRAASLFTLHATFPRHPFPLLASSSPLLLLLPPPPPPPAPLPAPPPCPLASFHLPFFLRPLAPVLGQVPGHAFGVSTDWRVFVSKVSLGFPLAPSSARFPLLRPCPLSPGPLPPPPFPMPIGSCSWSRARHEWRTNWRVFVSKVSLEFNRQRVRPGDQVSLVAKATPGSHVAFLAVDKSVLLMNKDNDISADQVRRVCWLSLVIE